MFFEPFSELDRLGRQLSSVVDQAIGAPVDIHREDDRYVVTADLPGVDPGSVDVTFEGNTLTIRAERSADHTPEDRDWVVREREAWSFVRRFSLGDNVDPDAIEARYDAGVLTVALPFAAGGGRRKIAVGDSAETKALGSAEHQHRGRGLSDVLHRLPWSRRRHGTNIAVRHSG